MIRMTLEATTQDAASLGIKLVSTLIIRNDGTGTEALGNYVWGLLTPAGVVESHGRIVGHPRQDGAWALVRTVLDNLACNAANAAHHKR